MSIIFNILSLCLLTTTVIALEARQYTSASLASSSISRSNSSISAAWFAGWHATDFPLSRVSWSKYTHLTYAFATTTPDVNILFLGDSDVKLLPQFVSSAHSHSVKASLSIGGWTGSRWFSSNVGSAANRTTFVKTVTDLAERYQLDGIDFDWEFPGIQGIGCNVVDPNDTNNFLSFLEELRSSSTGKKLILSAAVFDTPWVDTTGLPSSNISGFSQVLDYIAIMNYDVKSNVSVGAGPNAPLDNSCAPSGAQFGSAMSAVKAWTAAGIPASQIVLGVPAYGHSFVTNLPSGSSNSAVQNPSSLLYPPYLANVERVGDKWDGDGGLDVCGVEQGPGGIYTYWGLMQEGFLDQNGLPLDGILSVFDNCSQTPFLYNATSGIYVSYDNAESFAIKGGYIHSAGLKGFAIWEAGGDHNDTLLNSILNATQNGGPNLTGLTSKSQGGNIVPTSAGFSLRLEDAQSVWRALLSMSIIAFYALLV